MKPPCQAHLPQVTGARWAFLVIPAADTGVTTSCLLCYFVQQPFSESNILKKSERNGKEESPPKMALGPAGLLARPEWGRRRGGIGGLRVGGQSQRQPVPSTEPALLVGRPWAAQLGSGQALGGQLRARRPHSARGQTSAAPALPPRLCHQTPPLPCVTSLGWGGWSGCGPPGSAPLWGSKQGPWPSMPCLCLFLGP